MKQILILASIISVLIIMVTSCEKVIDYELNSSDPRYNIEAELTNQAGGCKVQITKSVDFSEDNTFPAIEDAIVIISDNLGNVDTLTESAAGIYSNDLIGVEGRTYTLTISMENEFFTATTTMPEQVPFDTITFIELSDMEGKVNVPVPEYCDPKDVDNYYRFIEYIDEKKVKTIFVRDDSHTNGKCIQEPLISFDDNKIERGDYYRIIMMSIDENIYQYFYSLSLISDGSETGTPANPASNITGGTLDALGYFSAHTVQERTVIAP